MAALSFSACSLAKARSSDSGLGCSYLCDRVTLPWPAILMMVKASARASPKRVSIVGLNECTTKSRGSRQTQQAPGQGPQRAHLCQRSTSTPACLVSRAKPRGLSPQPSNRRLSLFMTSPLSACVCVISSELEIRQGLPEGSNAGRRHLWHGSSISRSGLPGTQYRSNVSWRTAADNWLAFSVFT